ncbi:MAG: hypothetical protein ACKVUT_08500 [Gaiella sp.]
MRVGIVDIGSNTARLLVADTRRDGTIEEIDTRRAYLGLGEEIARKGSLRPDTVSRAALVASAYAEVARREGASTVEVIVTAPGRQGDASGRLVAALERSTGMPVHVLSAEEEGRLAYEGAVHRLAGELPDVLGVVDVGGGSTEIVVGTPLAGPAWVRSLDIGSLRLTELELEGDPPRAKSIDRARAHVREALLSLALPSPDMLIACGGSARAVWHIVGRRGFSVDDLETVVEVAARTKAAKLAKTFGLHPHRARTLLAGTLILAETARALDRPFELAGGGLREGAALALAWPRAAAA